MSELHELCEFQTRPITEEKYLNILKEYLAAGIPSTYTLEEADAYNKGIEEEDYELKSTTTPLHLIARNLPADLSQQEEAVVGAMIDELFAWGAGWNLIDDRGLTPGDELFNRGMKGGVLYNKFVDAGVRAEILLRKINDDIEFLSDGEGDDEAAEIAEAAEAAAQTEVQPEVDQAKEDEADQAKEQEVDQLQTAAGNQEIYLNTKLEYKDDALITSNDKDGVMMEWESSLMKHGCETIFSSIEDPNDVIVLNIGFGMGIIDKLIQEKASKTHYICEAHPDVLAKMKKDGWFEKPNVVVLSGRWQDTLPELLNKGVFFDGIYYDTFSEHYNDMLDLYDLIVGLLKPTGTFSFFNGLGADRQVIYDVYKKIVEIDLNNYGLNVEFKELAIPKQTLKQFDNAKESIWNDINRPYWRCEKYYHPEIRFI